MHEDSCIGINYAHMFPKCSRSLHTLLGFALYFVSSIQLLSLYPFMQILTCTRIPCGDSHCENGSFEVLSLHPPSVAADGGIATKWRTIKQIRESRSSRGFIQRRQTTGFPDLSCRYACILIYRLSLNFYELHQESLHCHQVEEELDDWCHC